MRLPWRSKTDILLAEIDFLRAQVAQLQNYILMTAPSAPAAPAFPKWDDDAPPQRMYTTELEEDVEYRLQEGLIDESAAERILREAGFDNDEVEIS